MVERSSSSSLLRRALPIACIVLLACIFLLPVVFGGRVLLPCSMLGKMSPWSAGSIKAGDTYWNALTWDCDAHFYPSRLLLHRALKDHELPLWNPYQMCGMPCLADGQSGALYPPNLLFFYMFPPARAMGLLALLHLIAAGGFTFLFLRGLKLSRGASTFGAIAFMLCGYSVAWLHLPAFLASGVWLPLTLHLTRLAHERKSSFYAAWGGATIALSLLGHPQIAFYSLLATGLYWAHLTFYGRRELAIGRSAALFAVIVVIGLSLAAPQIIPMQELSSLSHRGGHAATVEGYAGYSRLAMPITNLIGAVIPDFFGNPSKNTFWGFNEYDEYCMYIGIIPLLLLPLAFRLGGRRREHLWFFGGLAVLALLMALGTAVNRAFYFGVPGFTRSGSPARVLFLFMFSAITLGSMGLDQFFKAVEDRVLKVGKTVLLAGLGMLLIVCVLTGATASELSDKISPAGFILQVLPDARYFFCFVFAGLGVLLLTLYGKVSRPLGYALIFCILIGDLLSFGANYNSTCLPTEVYPRTELTDFLSSRSGFARVMPLNDRWSTREFPSAVLPPNSTSVYGLYDVSGYDSLYPLRYKTLLDTASGQESCPPENGNMVFARDDSSAVYNLLGVRWYISRTPLSRKNGRKIDDCYVYRNENAFPRAFVANSIEYGDDSEILRRISTGREDLRKTVLISPDDRDRVNPWGSDGSSVGAVKGSAAIVRVTCNTVTIKVDTDGAGVLVLTDQYFPGWKAQVDGAEVAVTRADYDFRAVPVSAGRHTVIFSYEPESFRKGLLAAWLGFIALTCMTILGASRRPKKAVPANLEAT